MLQLLVFLGLFVIKSNSFLIPACIQPPSTPQCTYELSRVTPSFPECAVPISKLLEGRTLPGNSYRPSDALLPQWFNQTLALRGQKVAVEYYYPLMASIGFGVLVELNMPDIRDVLMYTGKSATPSLNAKRDLSSLAQGMVWFGDFFTTKPTDPKYSDFLTSIINVRKRHLRAAEYSNKKLTKDGFLNDPSDWVNATINQELWDAFTSDINNSQIPKSMRNLPQTHWKNVSGLVAFNQQAMAFVQYNFLAYPILFSKELGISACDNDLLALNYLSALIGYALGVDDRFNVALKPNLKEAKTFYREIFNTYIIPSLFYYDKQTHVMLDTVLKGIELVSQGILTPQFLLHRFLKNFVGIETPSLNKLMSIPDKGFDLAFNVSYMPLFMTNPFYRLTINEVVRNVLVTIGNQYYPGIYSTHNSRARWVFS